MKEQLICELVKTGKDAELMNKQYAEKIKALEKVWIAAALERIPAKVIFFFLPDWLRYQGDFIHVGVPW